MQSNKGPGQGRAQLIGLMNSGRYADALPLLKKMCKTTPKDGSAWLLLGIAQGALGAYRDAVESLRRSIRLRPGQPEAHYFLGNALYSQGRLTEACSVLQRAIDLKPDYWEAHSAMARALQQDGKPEPAIGSYRKAIAINPANHELHANLGLAWKAIGKNSEALASLQEAARLRPDSAEVLFNIGNLHHGQRELDKAEGCYRKAMRVNPGWIRAHLALARILLLQGEVDAALGICRTAHDLHPGNEEVVAMEAGILEQAGDLDGARDSLQALLDAGSSNASALVTWARLAAHLDNHAGVIALLEDRLGAIAYDREDARKLHFALADTYDAVADYDQAFRHYQAGNALKTGKFNADEWSRTIETTIRFFSRDFLANAGCARAPSRLPVFIIGMPRTGSTLLEQILDRHSAIYGAGELPDIKNLVLSLPGRLASSDVPYPECLTALNQTSIDQIASGHLQRLAGLAEKAARVIDKMPGNYLHLGLIQILFPGATLLHTLRDPVDTCLSCFTRDLGGGASFSADLTSLGTFYNQYRRLMAHWQDVLTLPIQPVRYEALVGDPETIIRGVLVQCGLDWEAGCLQHRDSQRVVMTPSYGQVRKPLYKDSVNKWHHYEAHLAPLLESLGQ